MNEKQEEKSFTLNRLVLDVPNRNRGLVGNVRGYSVSDLRHLTDEVRTDLQAFGPTQIPRVDVGTGIGRINDYAGLESYLHGNDAILPDSKITIDSPYLSAHIAIQSPFLGDDLALDQRTMLAGVKEIGADVLLMVGSSVAGAVVNRVLPGVGTLVSRGGTIYGAGKSAVDAYNKFVPQGVATIELVPKADAVFSNEHVAAFRAFEQKYR